MKKILPFLRSMRFGMLLLLPVLVCSVIGSVIPQGESESYYAETFPGAYHMILGMGLDRLFSGWVFLTLTALFSVNLALCSVSQLRAVSARRAAAAKRAETAELLPLSASSAEKLSGYLRRRGWKRQGEGERAVWLSPALSWFGSVITHFALLGVILGAAGIFALSSTADYEILPGENELPDGTVLRLEDFRIADAEGKTDYVSTLEVISPDGRASGIREISVNHPLRFGANKYYQQTYGVAGALDVRVAATGEVRPLYLTEQSLITAGGADGVWYFSVYPGYITDENGVRKVVGHSGGDMADPAYYIVRLSGGAQEPMIVLPGESVETADAVYEFKAPRYFPGIRVKTTSVGIYALLYASFALLTAGLYLCFFAPAAAAAVGKNGYAVVSRKGEQELKERFAAVL